MALPLHLLRPDALSDDLTVGQDALIALFEEASPRLLRAGQPLTSVARADDALYRQKAGWTYRFRDLSDGNRAIVDVYVPGDIIGFDAAFEGATLENVRTLTTTAVEAISRKSGFAGLLASGPIGLYIAWLLNERQRRTDFLRAATAALDARGRLASMVLDFYYRLATQGLITNSSFNLPLTQTHIGSYLGLTVVHVNRVIRSLRDDGLVNIEKHCVTFFDLKALAALAKVDSKALEKRVPARSQVNPSVASPATTGPTTVNLTAKPLDRDGG
jgi:CRP/FNR family transcriptional regulator, anaerobic regulatory protein